jgi:hypothetical protein
MDGTQADNTSQTAAPGIGTEGSPANDGTGVAGGGASTGSTGTSTGTSTGDNSTEGSPAGDGTGPGPGGGEASGGGDGGAGAGGGGDSGSGGVGCFLAGTPIRMADGTDKLIEDLKLGDMVAAFTGTADAVQPRRVVTLFLHDSPAHLIVNGSLRVTGTHRMLRDDGEFVEMGEMDVGDNLVSAGGTPIAITSIERQPGTCQVYNFEVEGLHTYIAGGFRVHNEKDVGGEVQAPPGGVDQVPQNADNVQMPTAQTGEYILSNPFIIALAQMLGTTPEGMRDVLDQLQLQTTGQMPFGMDGGGDKAMSFQTPTQPDMAPNVPLVGAPMPPQPPQPAGIGPVPGPMPPVGAGPMPMGSAPVPPLPPGGIGALQAGVPPRATGGRIVRPRMGGAYGY